MAFSAPSRASKTPTLPYLFLLISNTSSQPGARLVLQIPSSTFSPSALSLQIPTAELFFYLQTKQKEKQTKNPSSQ